MLETNLSAAIEKNILGKKKDLQVFFLIQQSQSLMIME